MARGGEMKCTLWKVGLTPYMIDRLLKRLPHQSIKIDPLIVPDDAMLIEVIHSEYSKSSQFSDVIYDIPSMPYYRNELEPLQFLESCPDEPGKNMARRGNQMKPWTIIDDPYTDEEVDIDKVYEFIKRCPELPELNDFLSVTFTQEEWDEIWGVR